MRIAGVDEAGRGCVIGPLVVAGALFTPEGVQKLNSIGVKDSKSLNPEKRKNLEKKIKKIALQTEFFELKPREIDKVVHKGKPLRRLNYLETMVMARILQKMKPDLAYVDPADVDSDRCARQIKKAIPYKLEVICIPKADAIYTTTGAASVLAKVLRDRRIEELKETYGDFGSGYPGDKRTAEYIKDYFSINKECPDFIRESWETVKRSRKLFKQAQL